MSYSEATAMPRFTRELIVLLIAQAIAGCTMPVLFLITGILGAELAPTLSLTTLPMSLVTLGIAFGSPLAAAVMSKVGRKRGHLLGFGLAMMGVTVAGYGLWVRAFPIYCVGCSITGLGGAFNNQIRFTAAEGAGLGKSGDAAAGEKAIVHSWILMFSLFAAILGPGIAERGRDLLPEYGPYMGSIAILLMFLVTVFLLIALVLPARAGMGGIGAQEPKETASLPRIPILPLLRESRFWVGAGCGIASFATMTLLMSATPLQMHHIAGISTADTTTTIQSHIVAMFLPSLFSGVLLRRLGFARLIGAGLVFYAACIAVATQSAHFHHYWWALVLLGVGWNFLFLASSSWISKSYSGPERFVAQGANDFIVFGTQAAASLNAGALLYTIGWQWLALLPLPLLAGLVIFMALKPRAT